MEQRPDRPDARSGGRMRHDLQGRSIPDSELARLFAQRNETSKPLPRPPQINPVHVAGTPATFSNLMGCGPGERRPRGGGLPSVSTASIWSAGDVGSTVGGESQKRTDTSAQRSAQEKRGSVLKLARQLLSQSLLREDRPGSATTSHAKTSSANQGAPTTSLEAPRRGQNLTGPRACVSSSSGGARPNDDGASTRPSPHHTQHPVSVVEGASTLPMPGMRSYGAPSYPNPWELAAPRVAITGALQEPVHGVSAYSTPAPRSLARHGEGAPFLAPPSLANGAPFPRPRPPPTQPDGQGRVGGAAANATLREQPDEEQETPYYRPPFVRPSPQVHSDPRQAPALGQCWGIKKDGMRCTRRVARYGAAAATRARAVSEAPVGARPPTSRPRGADDGNARRGKNTSDAGAKPRRGHGRAVSMPPSADVIVISSSGSEESDAGERRRGPGRSSKPSGSPQAPAQNPSSRPVRVRNRHSSAGPAQSATSSLQSRDDEDDDVGEGTWGEEYCHQHSREINRSSGFHIHAVAAAAASSPGKPERSSGEARVTDADRRAQRAKVGDFVRFDDWLGCGREGGHPSLAPDGTAVERWRARMRVAMSKVPAASDWERKTFLYVYSLRHLDTAEEICVKVGRAVHPHARVGEWRAQCQGAGTDPVLRAVFPRSNPPQGPRCACADDISRETSSKRGGQDEMPGGPAVLLPGAGAVTVEGARLGAMWEHLVHLELSSPHMGRRHMLGACQACGRTHREIFLVPRRHAGASEGSREGLDVDGFERVVQCVEKWERFVRLLSGQERA